MPRKSKLDSYADKIGILPDKKIAEIAGVSPENVRAFRKRRDIPARWRGQGEPLPNEDSILAEAGLDPAPKPKKSGKKRKAAKPKAKKSAKSKAKKSSKAKQKKATAKADPVVEPVVDASPDLAAEPMPEPAVVPPPAPTPRPAAKPKRAYTIRKPRKTKLDPYLDKVGIVPDKQVAALAGVTSENVRAYRKRRGIPAGWRDKAPTASKPRASARKPRRGKLTPYLDQLGTVPDQQIADMAGTTYGNVRGFRLRHGIPARWRGEGAAVPTPAPAQAPATKKPRKPRKGKLTPFLEELGILTDKVIGEKAGTTTQNVRTYRQRHGIPARWKGEGDPLPNEDAILALQAGPSSQPKPARGTEPVHTGFDDLPPEADDVEASGSTIANASPAVLKAYKVKVKSPDGKAHFVATGTNIVDAAQNAVAALAARSTEGEVVEMRFLAGVLGL